MKGNSFCEPVQANSKEQSGMHVRKEGSMKHFTVTKRARRLVLSVTVALLSIISMVIPALSLMTGTGAKNAETGEQASTKLQTIAQGSSATLPMHAVIGNAQGGTGGGNTVGNTIGGLFGGNTVGNTVGGLFGGNTLGNTIGGPGGGNAVGNTVGGPGGGNTVGNTIGGPGGGNAVGNTIGGPGGGNTVGNTVGGLIP